MDSLFAVIPADWAAVVGTVCTLLIALRTCLYGLVAVIYAIDKALDGKVDWLWPGQLADTIDRFDDVLDLLPVKAPMVRGKR